MTPQQRLNALLELVSSRGNVSIAEISEELGVSLATARRDLTTLAQQRLITRTHGGAAALGTGYELPLQYKIARQAEAKLAIARAAVELITPGETVGLNGGTTTTEVARELGRSERFLGAEGDYGITIVTNALNIGYELSVRSNVKIVVTGGVARRQSYELVGALVQQALAEFALDVVVLGVDGIGGQFGLTTMHEGEADVSRWFAEVGRRVIVVADSTKIMRSTFARICPLDRVDVLVTDKAVPRAFAAELRSAKVELVVAG
ncbi:DeoR/GlpR family DNA-binding transcription regulator [Gryllotalpicola ginsengisoli]|uniref:DeoR/GlpR family DNA-binding transcription regulator n=1 Tax=Gryllotalpicola ginsengisoli TaxID=444608 RepID=UPI0003B31965|nr:DeoR/GlpR family DNA-binding transcription regulator [Gryllotalpicola ginsengisoli]